VQIQQATGGVFVSWKLPERHSSIAGWRVYLNQESNLAVQIRDKGTRQVFIPLSTNTAPNSANVIVCSLTTLGRESGKVFKTVKPYAQATNLLIPTVPPGYRKENAGGGERNLITFRGQTQYIR
jgi:hypothetical protein